ncbi:peptidoglycan DD-metalloendopeptidase family protein [bacterium]|nr:peptidoglycan DD-metalloendopeptidase family protein [bacterium]
MDWHLLGGRAAGLIHFFTVQFAYSAILFVVIGLLTTCFKSRSRFLLMGLWSLVFIRLMLPLNWSHALSGRMLLERWMPLNQSVAVERADASVGRTEHFAQFSDQDSPQTDLKIWPFILTAVWTAGVTILMILYLRRLYEYRQILRMSKLCTHSACLKLIESWRRELGIRRQVLLMTGPVQKPPFTMGLVRPVIYIPRVLLKASNPATLESIIAHEMTHVKHWDDGWIQIQNIIQIIYFFNPIVWLAGKELGQIREQLCDAVVLSRQRLDREAYGNGLLDIIQFNSAADSIYGVPAFAGEKRRLAERIRHISMNRGFNKKQSVISVIMLLILGLILLPMGAGSTDPVKLVTPCPGGHIGLEYGKDWNPEEQKYYDHTGIDIVDYGKPGKIVAAAAGRVISTGEDEIFRGCYEITIQHAGGLRTRYLHIDQLFVKPGDRVEQGEVIGHIGFCVHFEVVQNGELRDPEDFLTLEKKILRKVVK